MINIERINKELEEYNLYLLKDAFRDLYWVTDKKKFTKLKITEEFLNKHTTKELILVATNTFLGTETDKKNKLKTNFKAFYENFD